MNKKYEYKIYKTTKLDLSENILNAYGSKGWELVGYSADVIYVTGIIRTYQFIFKREIE